MKVGKSVSAFSTSLNMVINFYNFADTSKFFFYEAV